MPSHPNRSRRGPRPGYNPSPAEIRQLRDEMGMTQEAFGRHLYASTRIVQDWESGARRCPALTWEYASLLWGFRAVAAAREQWVRDLGGDSVGPFRSPSEEAEETWRKWAR